MTYILYVEDVSTDAELAQIALDQAHIANKMVVRPGGKEALDFLTSVEALPLFILIDLGLPSMSGVQLIYELRHNEKTANIPLIILTGREDDEEVLSALGADAYLVKPLDVEKLKEKLRPLGLAGLLPNTS